MKPEIMSDLKKMAQAVHENAKAHGWWDEPRTENSIRALIHSEWSEALEEARAGRPLVWHECKRTNRGSAGSIACEAYRDCVNAVLGTAIECEDREEKPEGEVVELIDGCIRILDYLAYKEYNDLPKDYRQAIGHGEIFLSSLRNKPMGIKEIAEIATDEIVDELHSMTAASRSGYGLHAYKMAMCMAMAWVNAKGFDVAWILFEKHRHNET